MTTDNFRYCIFITCCLILLYNKFIKDLYFLYLLSYVASLAPFSIYNLKPETVYGSVYEESKF